MYIYKGRASPEPIFGLAHDPRPDIQIRPAVCNVSNENEFFKMTSYKKVVKTKKLYFQNLFWAAPSLRLRDWIFLKKFLALTVSEIMAILCNFLPFFDLRVSPC